jgi:ribosome-binding factor A
MSQGTRSERVGDQLREEISQLLAREVKDPGVGFVTLTHVDVTADLQMAKVFYTTLGDQAARRQTARALTRAIPFLRHQLGRRLRLRRIPELTFVFDASVERIDRIERILQEIHATDAERQPPPAADEPKTDE